MNRVCSPFRKCDRSSTTERPSSTTTSAMISPAPTSRGTSPCSPPHDDNRQAFVLAIGRRAQPPPHPNWVHNQDLEAGLEHLLHRHRRRVGFPSPALGEDGECFCYGLSRERQLFGYHQ